MDIVKRKIESTIPGSIVTMLARTSRGDMLQDIPLQSVEGSDFFTGDIFSELETGSADIAVHSLKDMSAAHFFGGNQFAVVDRDDTRDIAIFNPDVLEKARQGKTLRIGTCSPRREEMAIGFLHDAIPVPNEQFQLVPTVIRGNVDSRLRKLADGQYDGIILATAGLNRLLLGDHAAAIRQLLADRPFMLLPLVECVPAPCQGAIVAEAMTANSWACEVLELINNKELFAACSEEKKLAATFGTGCEQRFGVTTFSNENYKARYAGGRDENGNLFSKWLNLPANALYKEPLFSSADYMGQFFTYGIQSLPAIQESVVFVANYKAIINEELVDVLQQRQVWASGTKTWLQLAARGIWVAGCADAMGLSFLEEAWTMPLLNINRDQVGIITHKDAVAGWQEKGWHAYASYELLAKASQGENLKERLRSAAFVFWTSFNQYDLLRDAVPMGVQHACASGETANRFLEAGINPLLFPTIKSFQQWRQECSRSINAA